MQARRLVASFEGLSSFLTQFVWWVRVAKWHENNGPCKILKYENFIHQHQWR